ncbi:MAG: nucleotide exchange factor GrpE [Clostridia bacterium]|nr:nucleotide exchange factor GrpE [Clostridia bacterium]
MEEKKENTASASETAEETVKNQETAEAEKPAETETEPDESSGNDRHEKKKCKKLEAKIAELEKKLAEKEAESAEKDNKYLLLYAEYDNFRKRTQKEKDGIWTDAYSDAINKLLPVLDNLYRAVDSGCTDPETVTEGLKMTVKSYEEALKKMGVEEIPALGETFNPELHCAVFHIEDEQYGENEIVEVLGKGYTRDGKVIRYSVVKVAN